MVIVTVPYLSCRTKHRLVTPQDGQPCTAPVNVSRCPFCEYHVAGQLKAMQLKVKPQYADNNLITAFRPSSSRGSQGSNPREEEGRPQPKVRRLGVGEIREAAQRSQGSHGSRYWGREMKGLVVGCG